MSYNGELVGMIEARHGDKIKEVHASWFTESKKKRALSIKEFILQSNFKMMTVVEPQESDGFFALCRRGLLTFSGKHNNMNEFKS